MTADDVTVLAEVPVAPSESSVGREMLRFARRNPLALVRWRSWGGSSGWRSF